MLLPDVPNDVTRRLRYYRERVRGLAGARLLVRDVIPNQFTLKWSNDDNLLEFKLESPPKEEVLFFSSQMRPLLLKKDATNHLDMCSLLRRFVVSDAIRAWSQVAELEYRAI